MQQASWFSSVQCNAKTSFFFLSLWRRLQLISTSQVICWGEGTGTGTEEREATREADSAETTLSGLLPLNTKLQAFYTSRECSEWSCMVKWWVQSYLFNLIFCTCTYCIYKFFRNKSASITKEIMDPAPVLREQDACQGKTFSVHCTASVVNIV